MSDKKFFNKTNLLIVVNINSTFCNLCSQFVVNAEPYLTNLSDFSVKQR